ncbi:hypothetical protein LMG7974_01343 [Campylobacter majalis]|uniref:Uncharacterized protein n=1 Tax=Campylobacter majalis TaxID=2790656 RepID=A0ABN7KC78_9BACT|nr:hypothetical protein [Campylobacter majalis]CAD7289102.1 hypothetical protein LMG7974_01343 [Campylobacter majalis]
MKSLVKVVLIGVLSIGANAGDLLSKATGGAISENMTGVNALDNA